MSLRGPTRTGTYRKIHTHIISYTSQYFIQQVNTKTNPWRCVMLCLGLGGVQHILIFSSVLFVWIKKERRRGLRGMLRVGAFSKQGGGFDFADLSDSDDGESPAESGAAAGSGDGGGAASSRPSRAHDSSSKRLTFISKSKRGWHLLHHVGPPIPTKA